MLASFTVLCVGLILRQLLVDNRMAAFQHDWTIPSTMIGFRSAAYETFGVWLSGGLGMPNVYGFAYPLSAAWLTLSGFVGPEEIVVFTLFAALSIGAMAIVIALRAREPRISEFSCAVGGLFFVANPYVVNELGAGHIAELVGYAAYAWVIAIIASESTIPMFVAASWLAIFTTIAATQPQYGTFSLLAIVLAALTSALRVSTALIAITLALLCEAGVITTMIVSRGMNALAVDRVTLHWEEAQSRSLVEAFAGFGYAPHYAEHLYGSWNFPTCVAFGGIALCAFVTLFLRMIRGEAFARMLVIMSFVGVFFAAGLFGPFAFVLTFTFLHVDSFAFFRELYHFEALVMLTTSIGIALLIGSLRSRGLSFCALPALLILTFPVLAGRAAVIPRLPHAHQEAMRHAALRIAATSGTGRVLYIPLRNPMGEVLSTQFGTDPDAFPIGSHGAIAEFQPNPLGEHIAWLLSNDGDVHVRLPILAAYGVQFIVDRSNWTSRRFTDTFEPLLQPLAKDCQHRRSNFTGFRPLMRENGLVLYLNPFYHGTDSPIATMPARFAALPAPSLRSDDPRADWVDGSRWAGCFPELGALPTRTLFTIGKRTLVLDTGDTMHTLWIWAPNGARINDEQTQQQVVAARFIPVALLVKRRVTIYTQGPTAVAGISDEAAVDTWARTQTPTHSTILWARPEITRPLPLQADEVLTLSHAGDFPTVFHSGTIHPPTLSETFIRRGVRLASLSAFGAFAGLITFNIAFVLIRRKSRV